MAEFNLIEQILLGGVIAWSILATSILLVTLGVYFLFTLRTATQCPEELVDAVIDLASKRRVDAALETVRHDASSLAGVLEALLRAAACASLGTPREILADELARESLCWAQRIGWISLIAAVAPMMGLLGTVSGMIRAFSTLSHSTGGPPDPGQLAGAIGEALITTYLGLIVAIPAMILHRWLRQRLFHLMTKISDAGEKTIDALKSSPSPLASRTREPITP